MKRNKAFNPIFWLFSMVIFLYCMKKPRSFIWLNQARKHLQNTGAGKNLPLVFENSLYTAIVYDELGQYKMARIYYKKSLALAKSDSIRCETGPLQERLAYMEKAIKQQSGFTMNEHCEQSKRIIWT
ncbi:MAG: tetratricopeptide repeat protein [Deltaproteobacteria bacterium]|nr:tetratricopeptide repeat protein [Deltaproteobacteria bacterium]